MRKNGTKGKNTYRKKEEARYLKQYFEKNACGDSESHANISSFEISTLSQEL